MRNILILIAFFLLTGPRAGAFTSDDVPYLKAVDPMVTLTPLITVGESVPRTSNPAETFRLIGVPDGLGLAKGADGRFELWIDHELKKTDVSQPVAGQPLKNGAFVSRLKLDSGEGGKPSVASGDVAATTLFFDGRTWLGPPGLFCSGFLAGSEVGFDRPIYLTGEEATGEQSGDGRGGLGFAFVADNAYALPQLGRYRKENLVVVPGTGLKTALFGLEDGPKGLNSELYLYVGEKNLSSSDPLARNGLVGGKLYALASAISGKGNETAFRKTDRPLLVHWVEIKEAATLTDVELNAKAADAGAFRFDRIEDGTYDRRENGVFYFVTTGGDVPQNRKGRLYKLTFNPNNPLAGPMLLEILLEGDDGDPIVSPDNIDMNAQGEMMILEDFTAANVFENLKRTPSVWLYRPGSSLKPVRLAEVEGKLWESSGVIDASAAFGPGAWLLGVQAHTVSSAEASAKQGLPGDAQLVEGGQILLLKTSR